MKNRLLIAAFGVAGLLLNIPQHAFAQNQQYGNESTDDVYSQGSRYDRSSRDNRNYNDQDYVADDNYRGDNGNYRNNRKRYDDGYVCRRGFHRGCRHERFYMRHHRAYAYNNSCNTRSAYAAEWIPGHWEYSRRGHRYWVPGHHSVSSVY